MSLPVIRIDKKDGSETRVSLADAEHSIRENYRPAEPVIEKLRQGEPIITTHAIFQLDNSRS